MKRLLWIVAALGCLGAGGSPLVAWYMDRTYGVDVQMIAPHAPEVAAMERLLADETTPVVSLYGEPLGPPIRLVLLERSGLIQPAEQKELQLLPVDKQLGQNPLQAKTVWFVSRWVSLVSAAITLLALGVWLFLVRRRNR